MSPTDDPLPDLSEWKLTGSATSGESVTLTWTAEPVLLTIQLRAAGGAEYPRHPRLVVRGERAESATRLVQEAIREAARHVVSQPGPLTRSEVVE